MIEKGIIKVVGGLKMFRRNGSIWEKYVQVSLFSPKKIPRTF
jgi:hypothetical protein